MMRAMKHGDILRVAEICAFARRVAFKGILSDEHLFVDSSVPHYVDYFERDMGHVARQTYVYDDGLVKGFVTMQPCEDGCLQILRLYVEPPFQGVGVGSLMLDFCHELAASDGYGKICLWVLEKNIDEIRFYQSRGFATDEVRKTRKYSDSSAVQVRFLRDVKKC